MSEVQRLMAEAEAHFRAVRELADQNLITWAELKTPKPLGMRSFEGRCEAYIINVVEANIAGEGIRRAGLLVAKPFTVIKMKDELAEYLYRKAARQQN